MSEVWFAVPSAYSELASATFKAWKDRGYKTAALINPGAKPPDNVDLVVEAEKYLGYGWACNRLGDRLTSADWIVHGGDDGLPDPHDPQQIAKECEEHFGGTFGVMQPIGDSFNQFMIKDFAGSPWIGREFRRRVNRGFGPWWESYRHFFDDNELQEVAILYKAFWQRPDLVHYHNHWTRRNIARPQHLREKATWWAISKKIFDSRKAAGFPGCDLIP